MKHIMKYSFRFLLIIATLIISSCTNPTTNNSGTASLKVQYGNIRMGNNSNLSIGIAGGKKPYSIKSISDSSIAYPYVYNNPYGSPFLQLNSKAIGSTRIIVKDSLGITGEVNVTVVDFAVFPSSVEMNRYSSAMLRIQGGTFPYKIVSEADSTIASIDFSTSYISVYGVKNGVTSLTIKDSSPNPKMVLVPIYINDRTANLSGKLSFNSNVGNYFVEGIYNDQPIAIRSSGAAGFVYTNWSRTNNNYNIFGSKSIIDHSISVASIQFTTNGEGNLFQPIPFGRTSIAFPDFSGASFIFYPEIDYEIDLVVLPDSYILTSGQLSITSLTDERVTGIFYGWGYKHSYQRTSDMLISVIDSTKPISVTNGVFDVPLYIDESDYYYSSSKSQKKTFGVMEKIVERRMNEVKKRLISE